ncbi:MAG: hypothetical protein QNJ62_06815 [Methyloceanibacter sp.]|nr:hypothetical protein [Methyloceanibacter sp.]
MPIRSLLALFLATSLTAAAPPSALAEEQMSWTVNSYPSDFPEETDTVILTYGIPETDAVAFEAVCGGPDGSTPRVVFWYDTVDLTANEDVVLSLSAEDFADDVPAKVYGKDAEVGVSGLEATFSVSAPIWQVMKQGGVLTYGIAGGQFQKLQLSGAQSMLRKFTAACSGETDPVLAGEVGTTDSLVRDPTARTIGSSVASSLMAAASVPPDGSAASAKVDAVSCTQFGKIRSMQSKVPVTMTFVNKSDGYRGIVWIDTEGTPIDNTGLNRGETAIVPTFETHAWMITDGPGNCIEMVVAGNEDATFDITAPAPAQGPEND